MVRKACESNARRVNQNILQVFPTKAVVKNVRLVKTLLKAKLEPPRVKVVMLDERARVVKYAKRVNIVPVQTMNQLASNAWLVCINTKKDKHPVYLARLGCSRI
jgi:predicted RNase H-like nuclease